MSHPIRPFLVGCLAGIVLAVPVAAQTVPTPSPDVPRVPAGPSVSVAPVRSAGPFPSGPVAPARPSLAQPLDASDPPSYRPRGEPTAVAEADGVRVELWVRDATLRQGQWLRTYVRVTNVSGHRLRRWCDGLDFHADTHDLFAPGLAWSGVEGDFKQRWLAESGLTTVESRMLDYRPAGESCRGDVAARFPFPAGHSIGAAFVALPRYRLRDQPLPGGTFTITAGYQPDLGRAPDVIAPVSTTITLEGEPFPFPSPGDLADRALGEADFRAFLAMYPDPATWANTGASFWEDPPYPPQPRLDGARGAPDGILEVNLYTNDLNTPWVGGVVLDPWTGESFGAYTQ